MKKATFLAAASLWVILSATQAYAQDSKTQAALAITQPLNAPATASSTAAPAHEAAVSTLSLRAIKDFKSRFAKVEDEYWGRSDKGYYVYFTKDAFKVRAYYDRWGHWQASLTYANESRLPFFIRDIVKRTYYDYAITVVEIVEVPGHMAYVVHMEDQKTFKIVRVSEDGDMDVLKDLDKTM